MKKFIEKTLIIASAIIYCMVTDTFCMDFRRHIFPMSDDTFRIEDEGFRWRSSFNFNINLGEGPVAVANWFFRNEAGFVAHETQADGIHVALSTIVDNIIHNADPAGSITHVATAAVTVVIKNPNNQHLEAYSEVIRDQSGGGIAGGDLPDAPAVSIPAGNNNPAANICNQITQTYSMFYTNTKFPNGTTTRLHLQSIANDLVEAQIPTQQANGGRYSCCEGQIIARLFDARPPLGSTTLFHRVLNDLITEANNHLGGETEITQANIVLVILHIHSRFDPCAKCSKVLSGLSRQMNTPATLRRQPMKDLLSTQHFVGNEEQAGALTDFFARLNNGEAYFLIEVSSDRPYHFNNGNVCSCAELAGKDANIENEIINIRDAGVINFNNSGILSIPYPNKNWYFPLTFPPYVVYGRINGEQVVVPENCGNAGAHPNFHETIPELPTVQ